MRNFSSNVAAGLFKSNAITRRPRHTSDFLAVLAKLLFAFRKLDGFYDPYLQNIQSPSITSHLEDSTMTGNFRDFGSARHQFVAGTPSWPHAIDACLRPYRGRINLAPFLDLLAGDG